MGAIVACVANRGRERRAACVWCGRKRGAVWRRREDRGRRPVVQEIPENWAVRRVYEQVAVRRVAMWRVGAYSEVGIVVWRV